MIKTVKKDNDLCKNGVLKYYIIILLDHVTFNMSGWLKLAWPM